MRALRVAFAALCLAAAFDAAPVGATAFSVDQSDLWWNAAESGWGIQFVQRASTIFATMFVYGPTGAPAWYVATMNSATGASWTGDLYATTGPWFGAPFNPAAVTARKVGTMTWTPATALAGTLAYSVDGVPVTKNIVRQFIAYDNFNGTYLGALHQTMSGCADPSKNGTVESYATLTVVQTGLSANLSLQIEGFGTCTIVGTLGQDGRFGSLVGTVSCGAAPGPITLSSMVVGFNSLAVRYDAGNSGNGCVTGGYFAGARHR
jgi:hypothetical protein